MMRVDNLLNFAIASIVGEADTNVLESELEVPTHDLTSRKCMLNVFLKCMLGL